MKKNNVKIVYIAGFGRSGSTLLARLLGELEGFLNVGEAARYLFNREMMSFDLPCGCGRKVFDCPFWKDVVSDVDIADIEFGTKYIRIRYLPLLMSPVKPHSFIKRLRNFQAATENLYKVLAEKSNSAVIVDASKNPSNAYILSKLAAVELYVVHLVRDPRGVISSWSKPKRYLSGFPPLKATFSWLAYNLSSELLRIYAKRYLLIRYEDFVRKPKYILEQIVSHITGKPLDMNFLHGNQASVNLQHALAGNPDKLIHGTLSIKEREWYLPWRVRSIVSILALPLLWRYHYPHYEKQLINRDYS